MSQPKPRPERRGDTRRQIRRKVEVACHSEGMDVNLTASVLNLSRTGAGLVVMHALQSGHRLQISLVQPNHSQPVTLWAEVIWSVAVGDGQYCVGARFEEPISRAVFQSLAYP